jgi:methionyl-tRNA formyltransferase
VARNVVGSSLRLEIGAQRRHYNLEIGAQRRRHKLELLKSRIVFMGTAELACASLKALGEAPGLEVVAVVTQPDRPKGRALKLHPSPVKEIALGAGLPVLQPERARDAVFLEELRRLQPDFIVVAAYGQLLPAVILTLPALGCVNVHTSLLPKYRGAAPIQWAILNDEAETGVTIMKMAEKLDAGDILSRRTTAITPQDTAATLHDRLALMGAQLLAATLAKMVMGIITAHPQVEAEASYARKITKEDGRLDWSQPARALWNRVRAFTPWPGAFTCPPVESKWRTIKICRAGLPENQSGAPGVVLKADKEGIVVACGQGALRIQELQLEGGRRLTAAEFLSGHSLKPGERLG